MFGSQLLYRVAIHRNDQILAKCYTRRLSSHALLIYIFAGVGKKAGHMSSSCPVIRLAQDGLRRKVYVGDFRSMKVFSCGGVTTPHGERQRVPQSRSNFRRCFPLSPDPQEEIGELKAELRRTVSEAKNTVRRLSAGRSAGTGAGAFGFTPRSGAAGGEGDGMVPGKGPPHTPSKKLCEAKFRYSLFERRYRHF